MASLSELLPKFEEYRAGQHVYPYTETAAVVSFDSHGGSSLPEAVGQTEDPISTFEILAAQAELPVLQKLLARVEDMPDEELRGFALTGYWEHVQQLKRLLDTYTWGFVEYMSAPGHFEALGLGYGFFSSQHYMERLYLSVTNLHNWLAEHQQLLPMADFFGTENDQAF